MKSVTSGLAAALRGALAKALVAALVLVLVAPVLPATAEAGCRGGRPMMKAAARVGRAVGKVLPPWRK